LIYGQNPAKIESFLSIETKGTGTLITRDDPIECITCLPFFERIQDNPFHHFAIYSRLTHTLTINNAITAETGIYAEERSFSGGSNTLDNWVVFLKFY
jgi:hypothetical protein